MKLIIDIPEEKYKEISNNNPQYSDDFNLYYVIKNGVLLDDAIKEAQAFLDEGDIREFEGNMQSGHHVFDIFIKHTGKGQSE